MQPTVNLRDLRIYKRAHARRVGPWKTIGNVAWLLTYNALITALVAFHFTRRLDPHASTYPADERVVLSIYIVAGVLALLALVLFVTKWRAQKR